MLIHQIPPKPDYLRVKIGRRLTRIGAVALKNTVYVLPRNESSLEDFQWVLREVIAAGGEAALLQAHLIGGISDDEMETLFRAARDTDYSTLAADLRASGQRIGSGEELNRQSESELSRFERRFEEISAIDFFSAPGREAAHGLLVALKASVESQRSMAQPASKPDHERLQGRTWVTRTGIHIDRIASAWLIRRFIDSAALFKFVTAKGYEPEPGELRFDMYDAEFTHEGDQCTFEVLCSRFAIDVPGVRALAELVHDIDLKDGKFGRPEIAGLEAQIAGMALLHRDDESRLARGSELFDELLRYFSKRRG